MKPHEKVEVNSVDIAACGHEVPRAWDEFQDGLEMDEDDLIALLCEGAQFSSDITSPDDTPDERYAEVLRHARRRREWKLTGLPPDNLRLFVGKRSFIYHEVPQLRQFTTNGLFKEGDLLEFWKMDENNEKDFLVFRERISGEKVDALVQQICEGFYAGLNMCYEESRGAFRVKVCYGSRDIVIRTVNGCLAADRVEVYGPEELSIAAAVGAGAGMPAPAVSPVTTPASESHCKDRGEVSRYMAVEIYRAFKEMMKERTELLRSYYQTIQGLAVTASAVVIMVLGTQTMMTQGVKPGVAKNVFHDYLNSHAYEFNLPPSPQVNAGSVASADSLGERSVAGPLAGEPPTDKTSTVKVTAQAFKRDGKISIDLSDALRMLAIRSIRMGVDLMSKSHVAKAAPETSDFKNVETPVTDKGSDQFTASDSEKKKYEEPATDVYPDDPRDEIQEKRWDKLRDMLGTGQTGTTAAPGLNDDGAN